MADRDEIIAFLDELLDAGGFDDYGPNGLQVPGASAVTTVATGVSAHLELFEAAQDAGAQLVLAHHGLFWEFHPRALSPQMAARLRLLLANDISLAAYHLPLDAHPEVGNNALVADGLGCVSREPFAEHRGRTIGFAGRFAGDGIAADELVARVAALTGRAPLVQGAGPDRVRTIGIVSGGAAGDVHTAVAAGLDAFLTGEPAEHAMADAREGGLHFIAAGHYATETFGIRRVGDLVAERFGVEHVALDLPNPV
jgi:dinuclear metal center YbgI/SA1388 family protein